MLATTDRRFPDRHVGSNHDPLETTIVDMPGETPVDLSEVDLEFSMRNRETGELAIDGAEASGSTAGRFTYAPTPEDLATAGEYQCQLKLTFPDTTVHYTLLLDLRILANL